MEQDLAPVAELLRRDPSAARDALSPLIAERGDDPTVLDLHGELLLRERRPGEALDVARRALDRGGASAERHARLGRCLNNLGRLPEAEQEFRRATALDPESADAHAGLGHVLRRLRRLDESERALTRALECDGRHPRALRILGMLRLTSGRPAEAAELFRTAIGSEPGRSELHGLLGIALHRCGELEEAEQAYRHALDTDDGDVETWMNLGIILQDRGQLDDAIGAYREAAGRSHATAAPRHRLAEALLVAGRAEAALEAAEEAQSLDPGHPTAIAVRIAAERALGRREEADRLLGLDQFITSVRMGPPPGYADTEAFNAALARHVLAHPSLSYEPDGHATRRGRHTRDLLVGDKGPVAALEAAIIGAVDDYLDSLSPPPGHPFPGPVPRPHRLTMWAVVMDTEGHQLPHIHPAAWLSGVYYVELPGTLGEGGEDTSGWIEFGRAPDELRGDSESPVRLMKPVAGRMWLFPSYLYHRTIPFSGDERRISIAFDLLRKPGG